MSAIGRVTRAAIETQRTDLGENRIPAVWRARVVYIREAAADCGHRPGVYITVPNFTRGEIHGPVQVVGDTPSDGDSVVAVAVEGRKNDWIIITPSGMAALEKRIGEVEDRAAATQSQIDTLDNYVEHYITARMGRLEWDVDEVLTPRVSAVESNVGQLDERVSSIPGIEVDTNAGTRVDIAGHTIFYDSGWRSMPANGVDVESGNIIIKRLLNDVIVFFDSVQLTPGSGQTMVVSGLPWGFRPDSTRREMGFIGTSFTFRELQHLYTFTSSIEWNRQLTLSGNYTNTRPSSPLVGVLRFPARVTDSLPTSLPGTPA